MYKIYVLMLGCLLFAPNLSFAQKNIVTYAGNAGKETFYDVLQISDGSFLVSGYASDLDWIAPTVPHIELGNTSSIHNTQGTNRVGFLLHLSADFQKMLHVVHFPLGHVEDVRFIKTNTLPYQPTGDLYISGTTNDTRAREGGYFLAKLDYNFIDGIPGSLIWVNNNWAESGPKEYQPWDVAPNGDVYVVQGQNHAYDWSAMYCIDGATGNRKVVENWRTHWLKAGGEWKGVPASTYPNGGANALDYSGIVFKAWGRCDLRSWTNEDFKWTRPDENGGTKVGKWPLDVFFNGPCDPTAPTNNGPGYNGYSLAACCPVYGATNIVVDRRNGDVYLGMNIKSVAANGSPDFEPAVIAMDATGTLKWWSRLYHEITPAGDTVYSVPDQYVDALAIDYKNDALTVGARCHGNNVENFWEGNQILANQSASGFQNRFTGTNGNIHISWLGKLQLGNGMLTHSTYMAEYAEGTGALGTPHPDPNLDGWPNPNAGWPNVNTTRIARNNLKVSANGEVIVIAAGRRTITTRNAYQKMVKPANGGVSSWNAFVRVYEPDFSKPLYSSLVVGQWDTLTQNGGGNTELFGVYKTTKGVVCVGRQTADANGLANGNNLPVTQMPAWGAANPANETAILTYYEADNLYNPDDSLGTVASNAPISSNLNLRVSPNPAHSNIQIWLEQDFAANNNADWQFQLSDFSGRVVVQQPFTQNMILSVENLPTGMYQLQLCNLQTQLRQKILVLNH